MSHLVFAYNLPEGIDVEVYRTSTPGTYLIDLFRSSRRYDSFVWHEAEDFEMNSSFKNYPARIASVKRLAALLQDQRGR